MPYIRSTSPPPDSQRFSRRTFLSAWHEGGLHKCDRPGNPGFVHVAQNPPSEPRDAHAAAKLPEYYETTSAHLYLQPSCTLGMVGSADVHVLEEISFLKQRLDKQCLCLLNYFVSKPPQISSCFCSHQLNQHINLTGSFASEIFSFNTRTNAMAEDPVTRAVLCKDPICRAPSPGRSST